VGCRAVRELLRSVQSLDAARGGFLDEGGKVPANPRGRYLAALSLGTLGVVYGDIGTSPL
jgi:hypothetical protein